MKVRNIFPESRAANHTLLLEDKLLKILWTFKQREESLTAKQRASMSRYVRAMTKPSPLTLIDAYLTEDSQKMKAASSIGPLEPHHKHTQTDIQTGQLIETGAEVSPGS